MDILHGLVRFAIRVRVGYRVVRGFRSLLAGPGLKLRSGLANKLPGFV